MAVPGELGDLAHALGRRLHVLGEGDRVDRHLDRRQQRRRVVLEAGLPLRGEHRAVALLEVLGDEAAQLGPERVVAEHLGRVVEEGVVSRREVGRQRLAAPAQLDLRLLPLPDEARLLHARAHRGDAAHELRAVVRDLHGDQRAHREADERDGRRADLLDQAREVGGVDVDRPRRRAARRGAADAARVVRRVAPAGLERGHLPAPPVRARVVAGREPDDVRAVAALVVVEGDVVEHEIGHGGSSGVVA